MRYIVQAGGLEREMQRLLGEVSATEVFFDETEARDWIDNMRGSNAVAVLVEDLDPLEERGEETPGICYPIRRLHPKQREIYRLLESDARDILALGGGRSGKTFVLCVWAIIRALIAPGSRHMIARDTFAEARRAVFKETIPAVLQTCFPNVTYNTNEQDLALDFHNGSSLLMLGLDKKERLLGQSFATEIFSEANNIPYRQIVLAQTRLAQPVKTIWGEQLPLKSAFDMNPRTKSEWPWVLWGDHKNPMTGEPVKNPSRYAMIQCNPQENPFLPPEVLENFENLPLAERRRFLHGEFGAEDEASMFRTSWLQWEERFDPNKPLDAQAGAIDVADLRRIVIAVDPAAGNGDETGIVAVGTDGEERYFVVDDKSGRLTPRQWARTAIGLYDSLKADSICVETNFGASMCRQTFETEALLLYQAGERESPVVRIVETHSSRGKHVRAEPVAALYESKKVWHLGLFHRLEEQLTSFRGALHDRKKDGSPDRLDALVFGLTEIANIKNRPRKLFFATIALQSETSYQAAAREKRDQRIRAGLNGELKTEPTKPLYEPGQRIVPPRLGRIVA